MPLSTIKKYQSCYLYLISIFTLLYLFLISLNPDQSIFLSIKLNELKNMVLYDPSSQVSIDEKLNNHEILDSLIQKTEFQKRTQERSREEPEPENNYNSEINDLFIMIVSARGNFAARNKIRKTWAKNIKGNYKFLVGHHYCKLNPSQREFIPKCNNCNCNPKPKLDLQKTKLEYLENEEDEEIYKGLDEEERIYGDLYLLDMIDTYQNLTLKVKLGLKTIYENIENGIITNGRDEKPKWVMKIDDDAISLSKEIENYLTKVHNTEASKYLYMGRMYTTRKVLRVGLWAEINYLNPAYDEITSINDGGNPFFGTMPKHDQKLQGGPALMYVWVSGHLGVWASGRLGVWASGLLGIWASGHQIWFDHLFLNFNF